MTFFGPLQELRQRPIPDLREASQKRLGYRTHKLDLAHPANKEPLVDLRSYGIEGYNYYNRPDNPPYYEVIPGSIPDLFLRKSVAETLQGVDKTLRAQGLKLHVHDAWRPTEVQAYMHDVSAPAHIRQKQPGLAGAALTEEVEKYWAAPTVVENSPAPHNTGGAVDLTIFTLEQSEPLFMGTIFDDASIAANTDAFENHLSLMGEVGERSETGEGERDKKPTSSPSRSIGTGPSLSHEGEGFSVSADEARHNRRLIYWLMLEAGFANTPTEWWHYSFGDQLWARLTGADAAWYGATTPNPS